MGGQIVAQAALFVRLGTLCLFAQGSYFTKEQIYLFLLTENKPVQFFEQVFGITDLDFEFGDAGFHKCSLFFAAPVAQGFLWGRWGCPTTWRPD